MIVFLISYGVAAIAQPVAPPPAPTPSPAYQTFVIAFQPVAPFAPASDKDLLDAFNARYPQGVRTHHFKTRTVGGVHFGYICVDWNRGKEAVEAMLNGRTDLKLAGVQPATPDVLQTVYGDANLLALNPGDPPRIIASIPEDGATNVDPAIAEVAVTFDRDMGGGMSWTGGSPGMPEGRPGMRPAWRDKRTCVLPVVLQPGRRYRIGINAPSFKNFRSLEGVPVNPTDFCFTTAGGGEGVPGSGAAGAPSSPPSPPRVVSLDPPNGASDVNPSVNELQVTFDQPMSGGMSWCGGGPNFPVTPDGLRPHWTEDQKTCILPVQLKPNWSYALGVNCVSFQNFRSVQGVSALPVEYTFSTGSGQ